MELTHQQSLREAGLEKNQAAVYEALVKLGPSPASDVARSAGIGRALTYKVLDELITIGLAEKDEKTRAVARFSAAHPLKLKEVVEKRLEAAQGARTALDGVMGALTSDFNLQSGKPGVRFFEGLSGVKAVLEDSLTSQEEILAYGDLESIEKHISAVNKDYVRARERLGIKKRGFALDTPFSRQFLKDYAPGVTETKLLAFKASPFQTVMQIYDGKISYITLSDENLMGVIIADRRIYEMHRDLFFHLWNMTPAIGASQKPPESGQSRLASTA